MRLTDLFMELIAYVAYFNRSVATRQPAFDQVKADIDRLMSDIESRLERTQIAPDEFASDLDPVYKVKEEILNALYAWRLGHAKVPARYFHKDIKTTSGGVVEVNFDESKSLVEETEKQLRLRAIETKACMGNQSRGKLTTG